MSSAFGSPWAPGWRSPKNRRFASATWYQVFGCGAPGKFAQKPSAPVEPSVPDVGEQVSGIIRASMLIGTALSKSAAQIDAAYWKAIIRCWPSVVPGLPPIGAFGVGSLKPTPGALMFTMLIVELAK